MNRRTIASILVVLLVVAGAVGLGISAYNAGVSAGLAQTGTVVVRPEVAVGPYLGWGYGVGHGLGFFGFLGGLLFLFLVFALIRAALGGGRRGWGGPGGGWGGGPRHDHRNAWEDRARDIHDQWHREHGSTGPTGRTDGAGGTAPDARAG
jgi:hypothetical protein